MIFKRNRSGKAQHFTREYDKKVNLLALISLMGLSEQATPPQLQAAWPQLMAGVMRLLLGLKDQQVMSRAHLDVVEEVYVNHVFRNGFSLSMCKVPPKSAT